MIEEIKTYAGYGRLNGDIKMTIMYMHRCSQCGSIKVFKSEFVDHKCVNNSLVKKETLFSEDYNSPEV